MKHGTAATTWEMILDELADTRSALESFKSAVIINQSPAIKVFLEIQETMKRRRHS